MKGKARGKLRYEDLSLKLIDEFPELGQAYRRELEWWGSETPGQHIIYGDLFTPHVVGLLRSGDDPAAIARAFGLLEQMISSDDVRVQEVAVVTVLEALEGNATYFLLAKPHLGPLARRAVEELVEYWQEVREWQRKRHMHRVE